LQKTKRDWPRDLANRVKLANLIKERNDQTERYYEGRSAPGQARLEIEDCGLGMSLELTPDTFEHLVKPVTVSLCPCVSRVHSRQDAPAAPAAPADDAAEDPASAAMVADIFGGGEPAEVDEAQEPV